MFGGLEVKSKEGGSSGNNEPAPSRTASASASSFSFLQTDGNAAGSGSSELSASAAAPVSAFGFLTASSPADPPIAVNDASSGSQSGFSFLAAAAPPPAAAAAAGEGSIDAVPAASSAASSSFSFLGNSTTSSAADNVISNNEESVVDKPAAAGASSFSFLASPASADANSNNDSSAAEQPSPSPAPPAPLAAQSDLLSVTNAALPTGAGISWSAPPIQTKRLKKKTGKTRVGTGNASHGSPSLAPLPVSPTTPMMQPPMPPVPPSPQSPPLKVKAERAHNSAEEFIREKQRSAIALAAERAMLEKSEGGSVSTPLSNEAASSVSTTAMQWKLSNNNSDGNRTTTAASLHSSPNDETYKAAKAAAEEARKLENSPNIGGKSKFSLSGFFHRKTSSAAAGGDGGKGEMASYSSHGGVVGRGKDVSGTASEVRQGSAHGNTLPSTREEDNHTTSNAVGENFDSAKDAAREQRDAEYQQQQMERQRRETEAAERHTIEQQRIEAENKARQQAEEEEEEQAKLLLAQQRQSPRQKLQSILRSFASTTKSSTELVSQLKLQHEQLSQDQLQSQKNQQLAQQAILHAESLQSKACEEEDFESADRLASVIEGHQREMREQCEIGKEIASAMERVERQKMEAVKGVARCFGEVFGELKKLEVEQVGRRKEDGTDVLDKFAATSKRLSAETDRLNNDLKHIERDEELVADEQKELEDQIAEGTKEFEEKCAVASEKLEEVNKRVEDLRRQLMEAEAEAATLNNELSTHKSSIDNVRNKFSRQLGRLEKKQQSVKESRAEWELEKSTIEKEKTAHEAVVQAHSEDLLTMDQLLKDIQSELSVAKSFEDIISHQFVEAVADGDASSLDSEVLKHEAAVDEANRNVLSAEAAIQSLQEELATIDIRLPILEAEKKTAACKRDFKAAGKASKEIKDALARKEQCEAELAGDALTRKKCAKEELSNAVALLDEKKSIAAEKGREQGMKQMTVLKDKIRDLRSILKDFGVDVNSPDAVSVASVGAFVIKSQIHVLEASGEALGAKYGGWDDAAKNVVEDDTLQSAPTLDSTDEDAADNAITSEILEQYTALKEETAKIEAAIDNAAEEEDYEAAAELEEKLESVRAGIEALGVSPADLEDALVNGIKDNGQAEQDPSKPESPEDDIPESEDQNLATETESSKEKDETPPDIEDEKKVSDEVVNEDSAEVDIVKNED